ncbi:MAG TPA: ABC transporter ATP-binding protein, partial [Thermoleophilia bacterium]|nr:ABC transporter ATP-binding protein [Thermoleophilia bacterium]
MSEAATLLELTSIRAGYGHAEVLHDIDLTVGEGELIAVIGANGAGKSTLLKAIVGLVPIRSGTIAYRGARIAAPRPERLVRKGLALVPEGRLLFGPMTVRENLELGAYGVGRDRRAVAERALARVNALFPVLEERAGQPAETLSGGEQQMLAVGRALMSEPRLLLLDEPSLGLSPLLTTEIFRAIVRINEEQGTTIL